MMRSLNIIFRTLAVSLLCLSCSGNQDPESGDGKYDVPEGVLRIFADKETIASDGADKVTFTVMFGSMDVSQMSATIISISKDGVDFTMNPGVNAFSTTSEGEYEFSARFDYGGLNYSDNSVKVKASAAAGQLSSGYRQKMLAMQFTSIWCTYCPILATAIKDVEKNRPGEIIPVAFHLDFDGNADPMALNINSKFYNAVTYGGDGLPMFALNFRKPTQPIVNEYSKIVAEIDLQQKAYPAVCAVAIETDCDKASGKLSVKARFISDVANSYRYHIFLVEDGIPYIQSGSDDSGDYIHDNVLRALSSDNIGGGKLNMGEVLKPGQEHVVEKSFDIGQDWNTDNMRVVAAMLNSLDGGDTYSCNNANECPVGEDVDYLYTE